MFYTLTDILAFYKKKCATRRGGGGGCCPTKSSVSRWNGLNGKSENVEYMLYAIIFFNLSHWVWENNGLSNKNYWDDLDGINQGQIKDNVPQFRLYHGYTWTNFIQISTIYLWHRGQQTKSVITSYLENVGQGLKVIIYKNNCISAIIRQIFSKLSSKLCNWSWQRTVTSAGLENVG